MAQHQVYTPVDFNDKTVFNGEVEHTGTTKFSGTAEHTDTTTFSSEVKFDTPNITLNENVEIKQKNDPSKMYQVSQDAGYFTTRPIQVIVDQNNPINCDQIFTRSEYFIPDLTVANLCTGLPVFRNQRQYGLLEVYSFNGYEFSHEYNNNYGRAFQRLTTRYGEVFFRYQRYTNSWDSTWHMYLSSYCSSDSSYTFNGDGSRLISSIEDWAWNGMHCGERSLVLDSSYPNLSSDLGLSDFYDKAQRNQSWCYLYLTKIRLEGYFYLGGGNQYWYQQLLAPHDLLVPLTGGETSYKFRYPHTTTWTNGIDVATEDNIDSYKTLTLKLEVTYKRDNSSNPFQYWLKASTTALTISDLTSYNPESSYTHNIRLIFDTYLVK